ncbi:MAG: type II toxin-antitoxin system VapC family toxin [Planctomycetaceae bacterium]|jgi:predicted nucleic acid-binding protein|nr:type II toxin-antitoxin system VapC family toxin [Planctomycetaceae bacterium]
MLPGVNVDTCVLIEYFRAKNKSISLYSKLIFRYENIFISTIVLFEILSGISETNREFWQDFLKKVVLFPFDEHTAYVAAELSQKLRKNRLQVESSDLFIAATSIANNIPLATFNRKHFENIDGLKLVSLK